MNWYALIYEDLLIAITDFVEPVNRGQQNWKKIMNFTEKHPN